MFDLFSYIDLNKSIFFLIFPLLLLKIVVPDTNMLAPASIASLEFSKLIPPSISISKLIPSFFRISTKFFYFF